MFRSKKQFRHNLIAALVLVTGLMMSTSTPRAQSGGDPRVIAPNSSYKQLSARWWQWGMALPVTGDGITHPFAGCPNPPDAGQSGPVWFLTGQYGTFACPLAIPAGKELFFPLANAECSSLEPAPFHGDNGEEQRVCAKFWADAIDPTSLFCEIDGVPVQHVDQYRFTSPRFKFTAPTPWIFGPDGGTGTSVGDGYYLWLAPLSAGAHTIHFGCHSCGIDTTYNLIVAP